MAAAVVKKDGIRKRSFPQSSTKHMLSSPYHLQWPVLKNGGNKKIVQEITRTLGPFHFELLCTKTRKQMDGKERAEKQKQRSSLVMGVNEVTKALEKGTLKLVLVDRSIQPAALLEHLLLLCATREVPACAITGMKESTFPPLLGVHKVSAFAFKNTDTPTVFDDLVEFITKIVEPLYVPWLHSRKEGNTPINGNRGTGEADDNSDEEQLPGIQEMHEKKRRTEEDSMVVETDIVNLQCAGDSSVNLSDTKNSTMSLGGTCNSAVKKAGMNNSAANIPGTCDDDDDVARVQATDNSTVSSQGNENSQVKVHTIVTNPSGKRKRKRKRRARKSSKTNQNVGLACLRPCDDDVAKVQATDNSTVSSQGNENSQVKVHTIVTNPSGKRKRRRRARKSSKTDQNVGLAYLRPCVKSFDIGKDKGNQGK